MSRNGSYAKSMNGIVSFDDGDGTIIEGSEITTDTINCATLNASSTVNTPTINTDFIGKKANSYITVLNNTTFNGDINVNNINANTGTIYLKNNTSITGTLSLTSNIQTAYLEGRGIGGVGSPLNIGQSNDLTSYVNIGRDAITAGGFVFPAIPVRTTYIPTSNYDIVNKLYVDNATAGTNILALSNTFTGTTNTFNNTIATNNITSITTNVRCNLFNNVETEIIVIGDGQTTGTLYLGTTSPLKGRTGKVILGATTCNTESRGPIVANLGIKLPTATNSIDTDTAGATISLFDSLTTGILHVGKNIVGGSGILNLCNSIFITPNSIASGQTSDVSLFNSIGGTIGKIRMATNLIISQGAIDCTSVTDSIKLFFKLTTGTLSIGESMTNTGTLLIGGAASLVKIFNAFQFFPNNSNNSDNIQYIGTKNRIELLNTLNTTQTLNFGGTSTLNVGLVSATPGTVILNGKVNNRPSNTISSIRLFGYTSYVIHNGSSGNYTITDANINIDFYIVVIGTVNCSVLLNANIVGQRVYIRNAMGAGNINNVITPAGVNIIKAGGGITSFLTMTENTGIMFLCDGTTWIVMMAYP